MTHALCGGTMSFCFANVGCLFSWLFQDNSLPSGQPYRVSQVLSGFELYHH